MIGFEEIVEEFKVNFDSVVEVNDGGYELGFEQGIEHAKSTLTEKSITANGEYVPQGDSLGFNKVIVNVPDINGSYDNGFTDGSTDGYNNALEKLTTLEVNGNGEYLPSDGNIGFKKVVATGYLDTTDATATPEKILDGFTAYVNNEKIEGTIPKYTGESENAEIKVSKLASLVDGTITEVTEKDLAGATVIRDYNFYNCKSLVSLIMPNTVTKIRPYAIEKCSSLQKVHIPNSVTFIGQNAFASCKALPTITIPNSVTSIESGIFQQCGFTSINFEKPCQITSITNYMFSNCDSLTNITIPNSVTTIGQYAFQQCGVTNVYFEENTQLTTIDGSAFSNCKALKSIDIPSTVTTLKDCFRYCEGLESVTFGENIQLDTISAYTFQNCKSLANIIIPNMVTSIGNGAFYGCANLTEFIIPNSVTSIGNSAFERCSSLRNLTIPASVTTIGSLALMIGWQNTTGKATIRMLPRTNGETPPTIQSNSFYTSYLQAIEIPENELSAYQTATNWSALQSKFVTYQP